jgi:hypothetical protein
MKPKAKPQPQTNPIKKSAFDSFLKAAINTKPIEDKAKVKKDAKKPLKNKKKKES